MAVKYFLTTNISIKLKQLTMQTIHYPHERFRQMKPTQVITDFNVDILKLRFRRLYKGSIWSHPKLSAEDFDTITIFDKQEDNKGVCYHAIGYRSRENKITILILD